MAAKSEAGHQAALEGDGRAAAPGGIDGGAVEAPPAGGFPGRLRRDARCRRCARRRSVLRASSWQLGGLLSQKKNVVLLTMG
jgi:hypothetical protein